MPKFCNECEYLNISERAQDLLKARGYEFSTTYLQKV